MELYGAADRERIVAEPPKRVAAPERTQFERDRARVVHAASTRRLAAKTQVVGPQADDFVRNRLTHSLEVAQVARDLSRALNGPDSPQPDIAETAALAHDLGHPPFGHNGENVLAERAKGIGGFEGNAQTLRILTRLEAKTFDADGRSVGLNLTRATLDACTKYPWRFGERKGTKFGVYEDDLPVFTWLRVADAGQRQCVEAQIMDLSDDVAYSVHDVEDGIVAGKIDLARLDLDGVAETVSDWYVPGFDRALAVSTIADLRAAGCWIADGAAYDASRRSQAMLKNLTSDVIGRFCGAVKEATYAAGGGPYARYGADLVVPEQTGLEIALLKGIAAHYVMRTDERAAKMDRQRNVLGELVEHLVATAPADLDRQFADDWRAAADDAARLRVVIDQVASLTDITALPTARTRRRASTPAPRP
ncbi:deoxyguanosinetriphosphate triphosphohydrolase, partial [Nocardioides sp. NPDC057772]|uniref:deoxyguanosinetriphosphate triphosphohydrolase n=1 Tax=Nocardioides sp. NPDC057772 TaxID=3346245 RepID=UPI0036705F07